MPITDPGILDPNGLLYMEANPGDGGVHGANHWLSSDCIMAGPDPSFAKEGVSDTTLVTVREKVVSPPPFDGVLFDLYVCNPSLNIKITDPSTCFALASSQPVPSVNTATSVNWTPLSDASKPNGDGHRCLIARCYPLGSTPDINFLTKYIADDQHYVQHNLTIDVKDAGFPRPRRIQVKTGNGAAEKETVTIRVVPDFKPSATVLQAILPSLKTVPGFARIATTPVRHMELNLDGFKNEDNDWDEPFEYLGHLICDAVTGLFGHSQHPNIEAKLTIRPNLFADFTFVVDASGSNAGDAHIFHLTQTDNQGQYQGGLTVAVITA